jgi:hypothetical protein
MSEMIRVRIWMPLNDRDAFGHGRPRKRYARCYQTRRGYCHPTIVSSRRGDPIQEVLSEQPVSAQRWEVSEAATFQPQRQRRRGHLINTVRRIGLEPAGQSIPSRETICPGQFFFFPSRLSHNPAAFQAWQPNTSPRWLGTQVASLLYKTTRWALAP